MNANDDFDARGKYTPSDDDIEFFGGLGGYEVESHRISPPGAAANAGTRDTADGEGSPDDMHVSFKNEPQQDEINRLLADLARTFIESGPGEFARFVSENRNLLVAAAEQDDRVSRAIVVGYEMGIASNSAACANDLGACYYIGEHVKQDYAKAAELYELAIKLGCYQSIINMGYIYEYGRTGVTDYKKAYEYYALAAALEPTCEALYKLGDMYSRGKSVERDMALAYALWERSLDQSQGIVEAAQPAVRIAQQLIDPESEKWGIKFDPLRALSLFQQAEIGLRIDVANGQYYYRDRLKEAIDGQEKARFLIEADDQIKVGE